MVILENLRKRTRIRDLVEGVADQVLTSLPHLIFQVVRRKTEHVKRKAIIEKELRWTNIVIRDTRISEKTESDIDHTQMKKNLKIVVDI